MSETVSRGLAWLNSRGAGLDGIRGFLGKPLPRNVSWAHTLGSLLLVYLGFQALTGVLLGLYYSPSPEGAHASVSYVRENLFLGQMIYALHRSGAAFILITAFLHFARSYFLASYKAPRELLWSTGLVLGLLLTLFAFTGQILPFDQRGYWATVVGIRIASSVPVLGDWVRDLLTGGYGDIGSVTLSRFYVLHVSVLPIVFGGLLVFHLSILQRVGSAGPAIGSPEPHTSFYPHQAAKDVLIAGLGSVCLICVASIVRFHDSGPADPSATNFVPRPEWYFLAHYELLKLIPGSAQVLGTFVLPNVTIALLFLLPFLDRSPERSIARRRFATLLGVIGCIGVVALTARGLAESPEVPDLQRTDDPMEWGRQIVREKKCVTCHSIAGEGGSKGPSLDGVGTRLRADYMPAWIRNPADFDPASEMPKFDGTEQELEAVVSYLMSLK